MAKTQRLPVVGAAELEYLLNVSQQRAFQLINEFDFPVPWVHLRAAKLWLLEDIEQWAAEKGRMIYDLPAKWPPPRGEAVPRPDREKGRRPRPRSS